MTLLTTERITIFRHFHVSVIGCQSLDYEFDNDEFHATVHGTMPYHNLRPDLVLRTLLLSIPQRKNSLKSNQFFLFSCCILKWYVWKNGHGEHLYQPTFGYCKYSQILTKLMWRKLCTDWVYRVYCVHKLLGHGSEYSFLFSMCKMVTVKELGLQHSTMDSGASIFFSILHPYARVTHILV